MYEASAGGWPQTDGSSGMQVSGRVMAIVIAATHVSTRPARTQTCSRRCRTHRLTSIPDGANLTGSDSPRSGPRDSAGGVPQPGVLSPDRCVSPATCADSGGVPQGGGEGTEGHLPHRQDPIGRSGWASSLAGGQAPSRQPVRERLRTADPIFDDSHVDLCPGDLIGIAGPSMPNVLDPQDCSSLLHGDPFPEPLVPVGDVLVEVMQPQSQVDTPIHVSTPPHDRHVITLIP